MSEFYTRSVLYINDIAVGCLTSQSLSETIDFIQTCKRTEKGAISQLPQLYGYSIPFEAVMAIGSSNLSYEDLKTIMRNRTRVDWSIINLDINEGDAGQAFIENLQLSANTQDFIKFTGTLTGYGEIVDDALIYYVWMANTVNPVDNLGKYVLVKETA